MAKLKTTRRCYVGRNARSSSVKSRNLGFNDLKFKRYKPIVLEMEFKNASGLQALLKEVSSYCDALGFQTLQWE